MPRNSAVDRAADAVVESRKKLVQLEQAYDEARLRAFPVVLGTREPEELESQLASLDRLREIQKAVRQAEQDLEKAKALLGEAREGRALENVRQSLRHGAQDAALQRDKSADKLRTRANTVGAAIVVSCIGLLATRPMSVAAEDHLHLAIVAAAVSGSLFLGEWMVGTWMHQYVSWARNRAAERLRTIEERAKTYGKTGNSFLGHLPWQLAIIQTGLLFWSGYEFLEGVLQISAENRATAAFGQV